MTGRIRKLVGFLELAFVIVVVLVALFFLFTARGRKRLTKARVWADRIFRIWRRRRRQIEKNLSLLRPDLDGDEIREQARQVARTIAEDCTFVLFHKDPDLFKDTVRVGLGMFEVSRLHKAGQPIVLVANHVGRFDAAAPKIKELDLNLTVVVESIRFVGRIFDRSREYHGAHLEHIRGRGTSERAEQRLLLGDVTMVLIDIFRDPRPDDVVCQVGNAEVGVVTFPARLARKYQAKIYTLELDWDPETATLDLDASPFPCNWTDDQEADVRRVTEQLGQHAIQRILGSPGEWMQAASLFLKPKVSHASKS